MKKSRWFALVGTLLAAATAVVAIPHVAGGVVTTVVVPNALASTEGSITNAFPFNCGSPSFGLSSQRYQQVYTGSEVGSGTISQVAFRPDGTSLGAPFGPTTLSNVTIKLSTTAKAVDGLSSTFASNLGTDATTVYSGNLTLSSADTGGPPRNFDIVISLQTPFAFNASNGNLLLDVNIPTCASTTQFDAVFTSGDSVSRATTNSTTPGSSPTASLVDTFGLVTRFTLTPPPTATGLTSSANPSVFGQAVTFTATVCPLTGTTAPTGSVQFAIDGTNFGAPVTSGSAVPTNCTAFTSGSISSLLVGGHSVLATYTPASSAFSGSSGSLTQTVNCGSTRTSTGSGVSITSGSVCIVGASIGGSLNVSGGASVFVANSTVNGGVNASGPATVAFCNSRIGSTASISGASGFVLVGGDGAGGCPGNTLNSGLNLSANNGGFRVAGNRVAGSLTANNNNTASGTDPISFGPAGSVIAHNSIGGGLGCSGDVPLPSNAGSPNTVGGTRSGQCGPGF